MTKKHPTYQPPKAVLARVGLRLTLQASVTTPIEPLTPVEYENDDFWN